MSWYRSSAFAVYGFLYFTKSAFERASIPPLPTRDMAGKVAVITGANSGLGKEAALQYAMRGFAVHMLCRSEERGLAAQKEIRDSSKNQHVFLHVVDISRPKQIQDFVARTKDQLKQVDVLINNAAVLLNKREQTEDGLETSFATNVVGTYLLTKLLVPALQQSSDSRVINVTSGGMYTSKLDLTDLQSEKITPFDGAAVYAHEKRQMVIMTKEWASMYKDIFFCSVHPGWVDTPGVQTSIPKFYEQMKENLRTVTQGVDTMVWLGIVQKEELAAYRSGDFWFDRQVAREHLTFANTTNSQTESKELMQQLEFMCNKYID